ncbi:alpha/beta fold hydrolase [Taibaiella soli]|uniref:Alpha/beta hydrolase n=1 Tax=Taibaiella soli TaxID=1649169 RepID=A0A2W2B3H7_9BACT|nr:alpha/beta hydrolase [Taibaiella soli]PZF70769.1 alpha/beta hydrolase [Taibaiella soli]
MNGLSIKHIIGDSKRPTIIFLHDSLGCITLWRDFPTQLGTLTNCNVLVYDRKGYGESAPFTDVPRDNNYLEKEADVLNLLIEKLQITDAILFGHSDGGSIALIAAGKYPEHIKAVITEGAHVFVEDVTLRGIREAVTAYETTNLKEKLQKYHGDKTEAVFQAWAGTWLTDTFRLWNIEHFLPQIKCPVLVIQGAQDEYGTLAQVTSIVHQAGGIAESFIVPGIGHTPHKEAKEQVLMQVADFVKYINNLHEFFALCFISR